MSANDQIVNKPIKEMTAIEYLIYEKYIQWNQNGRPKDPRNDKAGHDAIQAAAELTAMQARFEKLEIGLAGDYCPSCTWRGNVTLVHGVCPYFEVDWVELKIKENEAE